MAKFYVSSGSLRMVVQADDPTKAALWAVHRTLEQILPIHGDQSLSAQAKTQLSLAKGCWVLDDQIHLSQIGFDDHEGDRLATEEVVTEWSQLMVAISKIESCWQTAV